MKKYQVFVEITGYIEVEAESEESAKFKVEDDGYIIQDAYKNWILDLDIEDVHEIGIII